MTFPTERPRRLRSSERLRSMVRETRLTPERLIYPLFVAPGAGVRKEIASLPGCFHLSVDEIAKEAREVESLGIAGLSKNEVSRLCAVLDEQAEIFRTSSFWRSRVAILAVV